MEDYSLTKSDTGSKVLYFTANPNGEAETVTINLRKLAKLKTLKFDINFADLAIKGKGAGGNIVTKNIVRKVELKSRGVSTLSALKIWYDSTVQRLNVDQRGDLLGSFKSSDRILTIHKSGSIELKSFDLSNHFDSDIIHIEKNNPVKPISVIYYDGIKSSYYVKRFVITNSMSRFSCITDHKESRLEIVSTDWKPRVEISYVKERGKERKNEVISIFDFIAVKGEKALGNKLTSKKLKSISLIEPLPYEEQKINESDLDQLDLNSPNFNDTNELKLEITNEIANNKEKDSSNSSDDEYNGEQITLEL